MDYSLKTGVFILKRGKRRKGERERERGREKRKGRDMNEYKRK